MDKKALIVITSHDQMGHTQQKTGWYLSEVSHVYFPLIDAGYQIEFASPKGGAAPMDENSRKLDDPLNAKFLKDSSITSQINQTIPLKDIKPEDYQMIHFAGGHGTMWDFPNNPDIDRITSAIYEADGIVAAICHGPAALINVKLNNGKYLIDGKKLCSFTNSEEKEVGKADVVPFLLESKLKEHGAKFQGGSNWDDQVVVSDRLITGQNPQSASSFGTKLVELAKSLSRTS